MPQRNHQRSPRPVAVHWRRLAAWIFALAPLPACAASPELLRVTPPGGQRGTDVPVVFEGARLDDPQQVMLYDPDLTAIKLEPGAGKEKDKTAHAIFRISKEARLGEHQLRLRTPTGITELCTFWVGQFPEISETEPNNDFEKPQPIPLNHTVNGTITSEDVDYFIVEAHKGQRLTAEIEGIRLGGVMFDPYVAILDEKRFELAASDDTTLLLQDSIASIVCPKDGKYIIQVRDSSYGGDKHARYRLHVGTFPRPLVCYPPGGQAGQSLTLKLLGDVAGERSMSLHLPNREDDKLPLFAFQDGQYAPSPNYIRVSPFRDYQETEPNDNPKHPSPIDAEAPLAINGVISHLDDYDYHRIKARKGQSLEIHVYARELRSPLDSLLGIYDIDGRHIASNDDTGGPDSYLRFNVPKDGEYLVRVRDHLRSGSPLHIYRIEITPTAPSLQLTIPSASNTPSQERQTIDIPRGGHFATTFRATREDFAGELALRPDKLPSGVTMHVEPLPGSFNQFTAVFDAAADAPLTGLLTPLHAFTTDPKHPKIEGRFLQEIELVGKGPNNSSYYTTHTSLLAIAVTQPAPFSVSIIPPKNPIPQSGSLGLHVRAQRDKGFKGAITVRLLVNPPGLNSATSITIAPDKTDAVIPMNANGNAAPAAWPVALLASADVHGRLYISSPLSHLQIAPAILTMKLDSASVERGQSVDIPARITVKAPFQGKAKLSLRGLPANTTADSLEIAAGDSQVVFKVHTTAKSPPGHHKNLNCIVELQENGEPITQTAGQGATLRIIPPATAEARR